MDRLLADGGVDTSALLRDATSSTGITVVLSAPEDRAVLTHLGAIPRLSLDQARAALDEAVRAGARHVHVASYFLLSELAPELPALLAEARDRGLTTSLDTNYDPEEQWDGVTHLLEHLDLLLPNGAEALSLAGRLSGEQPAGPEEAAVALAGHGPVVVVKNGADGALR